jgi:HEAT repeat protein
MSRSHEARGVTWRASGRGAALGLLVGGWLLAAPAACAAEAVQQTTCSFPAMLDDLRAALRAGTPEFQRYTRELLKEAALAMPPGELVAAIEGEREPAVLEALGAALATRASNTTDPALLRPLLRRAARDADPALRAAAVRGLRGTGSVEALAKHADLVSYEQLVRDPAPEVREAATQNVIHENQKVYFGHHAPATEAAISMAVASPDPALAARLLGEVSMARASPEGVRQLTRQLDSDSPVLRRAAATALGGVPASEAPGARGALLELYRGEREPGVRKAILRSIAQLGQATAVPTLESLRGVDPSMGPEIEAWLKALRLPVQEWSLIRREKERLRP